jgi:hypothetical protein
LALALLVYAVVGAARNSSPVITLLLTVERSLDFGIVVILFGLLRLPREYIIQNEETGERVVVTTGRQN